MVVGCRRERLASDTLREEGAVVGFAGGEMEVSFEEILRVSRLLFIFTR
jgi:hypothetical protein